MWIYSSIVNAEDDVLCDDVVYLFRTSSLSKLIIEFSGVLTANIVDPQSPYECR